MTFKAILFDLDGTLLEHDMRNEFIPHYFALLTKHLAAWVPAEKLVASIMRGSEAVMNNDGSRTNEEVFAEVFYPLVGYPREELEPRFMDFYMHVFPMLRTYTAPKPEARPAVQIAFDKGFDVVIATNPHFPAVATQHRLEWAGVADFPYRKVTTYENSHFAKPCLGYYQEILDELGCAPEEALMIGDEAMDMVAARLGCATFLVYSAATKLEEIAPPPIWQGTLADVVALLRSV
ncbi:MAG TPA: HAD family hydrolase [Anaerolineae bacterium]|nr:HAD family hydrolase [Anaerolineae bacterium]HQK15777.1 HAD family hydrolase [Anaerolineae bacterium]